MCDRNNRELKSVFCNRNSYCSNLTSSLPIPRFRIDGSTANIAIYPRRTKFFSWSSLQTIAPLISSNLVCYKYQIMSHIGMVIKTRPNLISKHTVEPQWYVTDFPEPCSLAKKHNWGQLWMKYRYVYMLYGSEKSRCTNSIIALFEAHSFYM